MKKKTGGGQARVGQGKRKGCGLCLRGKEGESLAYLLDSCGWNKELNRGKEVSDELEEQSKSQILRAMLRNPKLIPRRSRTKGHF